MKRLLNKVFTSATLVIALATAGITAIPTQQAKAQPGEYVSNQTFYDDLAPYGEWVNDGQYGNVWVPNEGEGFRPYGTGGHWVMTEYGNTWVSDYRWGWAPFHYGRWTYDNYYGWVWIPGNEWAPAWVSWRYGGGYSGWAPLSPGISIGISSYGCPNDWWVFVEPEYMYRRDYYSHWRGPQYNNSVINRTSYANNVYVNNSNNTRYNYGPRAETIRQSTNRPVPVYRMGNLSRPGATQVSNNVVSMYRPQTVREVSGATPPAAHYIATAPRAVSNQPQAATASNSRSAFTQQVQQGVVRPQAATNDRQPVPFINNRNNQQRNMGNNVPQQMNRDNQPANQGRMAPQQNTQAPVRNQWNDTRQQPAQVNMGQQQAQQRLQQQAQQQQQQMQRQQQMQQQQAQQQQMQRQQQMQQQQAQQQQMQRQQQMQQQAQQPQQRYQQMQQQRQQPQQQQQQQPQMQRQQPQPQQMQRQAPAEQRQAPPQRGAPPEGRR
ncbi:MAG: hypothetical protein H0X33_00635 [Taibaiella sp.]|nr:hypothetical protein [Taibaiella sp.]